MIKKIMVLLAICTLGIVGCSANKGNDTNRVYTLKVSSSVNKTHPIAEGLVEWGKRVEKRTNGHVKIELLPSGQLGGDEDVIEQAMLGTNIAVLTDGGRMAEYVKGMGIISMPYMGDSYDEMLKVLHSKTFSGFEEELSKKAGLRPLAFNWYDGSRNYLTNMPITKPEDLKGLRIRTPGASIYTTSIKNMGATPLAMSWSEVYNGIQSKAADGCEAQHTAIYTSRMFEVAKYYSKTEHFHWLNGIVVGQKWLDSLPKEYQDILIEECQSVATENARYVESKLEEYEKEMVKEGIVVVQADKKAFREAAMKTYEQLGFEEMRKQIWEEIGKE